MTSSCEEVAVEASRTAVGGILAQELQLVGATERRQLCCNLYRGVWLVLDSQGDCKFTPPPTKRIY